MREKLIEELKPHGFIQKGDYWLFWHFRWWWELMHWNFTRWENKNER